MALVDAQKMVLTRPRSDVTIFWRRRILSLMGWGLSGAAFFLLALVFLSIIGEVFHRAYPAFDAKLLTQTTNGISGGLRNAIEGTFVLTFGSLLLAVPVGVAAGIYLSEHGEGAAGRSLRFLSDVLVGVPSIVLGYFGYIAMVIYLNWQFSVAAGAITLAVMLLPYIARSTELALRGIPYAVREAAYALGAGEGNVTLRILLPGAAAGIMTGVLYALALSMGETAPLLYTAGWSNYMWNGHLTNEPVGYLTYVVWTFINEPFRESHVLAFAAAFLITFGVLLLILAGRWLLARSSRSLARYR